MCLIVHFQEKTFSFLTILLFKAFCSVILRSLTNTGYTVNAAFYTGNHATAVVKVYFISYCSRTNCCFCSLCMKLVCTTVHPCSDDLLLLGQNATAVLLAHFSHRSLITSTLCSLHWPPVKHRLYFRITLITHSLVRLIQLVFKALLSL